MPESCTISLERIISCGYRKCDHHGEAASYRLRRRIRTVLSLAARSLKPAAAAPRHLAVVEMCILSWQPTKLRRHVAWATSGRSLQIMGSVHWIAERLSDTCQLARTFFIH